MKIFALAASLRAASNNQQLIDLAIERARAQGAEVTAVNYADVVCPDYNQDDQDTTGFPKQADYFKELFDTHDGFIFSVPEYNYSIPGSLKNALDWVSRYRPSPTAGKWGYLLSASPSMVGGNRGLWATRQPLEVMGAIIYPGMFSLAQSYQAFNEDGSLKDEALQGRLDGELAKFLSIIEKQNQS